MTGPGRDASSTRPNVLVVMGDQHAPDVAGCYGNAVVQTPQIDRLAREGARFDRAYCNNPVCVPSRMSMLTGLQSSGIDVWCNADALAPHWATWPLLLRLAGYRTVISGRNHMMWGDRLYGFGERLCGDDQDRIPWVRPGRTTIGTMGRPQAIDTYLGPASAPPHAVHDREATDRAVAFIEAASGAAPFALFVGLYQPHAPFACLPEFYDLYDDGTWEHHAEGYLETCLPVYRSCRPDPAIDLSRLRAVARAYYGMVSHVDALVGELVAALERRGLLDRTFVLYTSDHGEMLGRHGLWHKMTFYEDSVRVPLVVRAPALCPGAQVCRRNVSLLDLFPTLLDLAGSDADLPLDGRSLLSLLADPDAAGHDTVLAESIGVTRGEPGRMLKRGSLKLIQYHGAAPVLFDLDRDPRETTNVAADPAYAGVLLEMTAHVREGWDVPGILQGLDERMRHVFYHHQRGQPSR